MSSQLVHVNQEEAENIEVFMRGGIRLGQAEVEYQSYLDNLFSSIDGSRPPKTVYDRVLYMRHPWHGVPINEKSPNEINCIIEIPALSRVKTELDKPTGLCRVDRILHSSVVYPANYGFIPQTFAEDNDPLDVLVLCQLSVPPLSLIRARPIGVMPMVDSGEADDKIIAVAINDPEYNIYHDIADLPPFKLLMINQFFNDYKTLERKEVRTFKPMGPEKAKSIITRCHQAYKEYFNLEDSKQSPIAESKE